ncbi:MAG: phosphotransferase, partial [Nocardiopsaceae bacterium]|nr:phosphotransferase [Nocardiopsaceae bacterium]
MARAAVPTRLRNLRALQDPLLRRGHLLTLSSVITAALGFAYWALAARLYGPVTVGRNAAAIALMMFLGGAAQLNLISALVRFLPTSGRSARSFLVIVYLTSIAVALVLAVGAVAVIGHAAPSLQLLSNGPVIVAGFVVATMAWTVFVLQDSAATGLRRTWMVPSENAVFSTVKLILLVPLAHVLPAEGIFVAWAGALAFSVIPVNAFLFKRAIPAHVRQSDAVTPLRFSAIARFASKDYLGALCWLAAINLMPLFIVSIAGAQANAYFAQAWVISFTLYLVSTNMGVSLVVDSALDPSRLADQCRQVIRHTLKVIAPLAITLAVAAPVILAVFGADYSAGGTTVLRLLLLSAIPNVVTAIVINAARAQQRTGLSTAILLILCGSVFGLSAVLLPVMGIAGVGVAWLVVQSAAAISFLVVPSLWLGSEEPHRHRRHRPSSSSVAVPPHGPSRIERSRHAFYAVVDSAHRFSAAAPSFGLRSRREPPLPSLVTSMLNGEGETWTCQREVHTLTDLTVVLVGPPDGPPEAVVKMAGSPEAGNELRAHVRTVGDLGRDVRLQGWAQVLPTILRIRLDGNQTAIVEKYIGGVDVAALLRSDTAAAHRGLAAALEVVGELHDRTGVRRTANDDFLEQWVCRPIATVKSAYGPSTWQASALDRLAEELLLDLVVDPCDVVWTHGDYTPGNVRVTPDGRNVLGVVDWGGSSPGGLAAFDTSLLLLMSRALRERQQMGRTVTDLLRLGRWPDEEQRLLGRHDAPLPHRSLVLLCWLHHVVTNLDTSPRYRTHGLWRAMNVDAVL